MVMPSVFVEAGYETVPLTLMSQGGTLTSFEQSTAGVAASVPLPAIGQIALGVDSKLGFPLARLVTQEVLCQRGLLSSSTPKFDPPTVSR